MGIVLVYCVGIGLVITGVIVMAAIVGGTKTGREFTDRMEQLRRQEERRR